MGLSGRVPAPLGRRRRDRLLRGGGGSPEHPCSVRARPVTCRHDRPPI